MRVLKPKLEAATAQYNKPEDQMQKQQAMMAEYSKYGVSPLSGCLPMLIQMPIIMGLFALLRNPLRYITEDSMIFAFHEPFIWIDDLSQPDPWILPIIAGVATFFAFIKKFIFLFIIFTIMIYCFYNSTF